MPLPLLALVSGPPGSGRPVLAARLASELGVPLVTRDAIRAGMVETRAGWAVTPAAELTVQSTAVFQSVVTSMLEAGVTLVAEHPRRGEVTPADLEAYAGLCHLRLVRCLLESGTVPAPPQEPKLRHLSSGGTFVERSPSRGRREGPRPPRLDVPVLDVTPSSGGYEPPLAEIVWFLRQPRG
jgi:hypothetical protein